MKTAFVILSLALTMISLAAHADPIENQTGNDITLLRTEDLGQNLSNLLRPTDCQEISHTTQRYESFTYNCNAAIESRLDTKLIRRDRVFGAEASLGRQPTGFSGGAPLNALIKVIVAVKTQVLPNSQAVGFITSDGYTISFFNSQNDVKKIGSGHLKSGEEVDILSFVMLVPPTGSDGHGPLFGISFKPFIDFAANGIVYRKWDNGTPRDYHITNWDSATYKRSELIRMIDRTADVLR